MPTPWIFRQLSGERNQLKLESHAAPHGRPRKGAVVRNPVQIRQSETYYPGNDVPTRHIFGLRLEPYELRGIFTDRYGGKGFAKTKDSEVRKFVAQKRQVAIVWGDRINARGLIELYDPGWEGDGEIPWTMTILIDQDLTLNEVRRRTEPSPAPKKRMEDLLRALDRSLADMKQPLPPTMRGDIFQFVESFIFAINEASASLVAVVDQIGNIASAPFHLLRTLRAGIANFSTAISRLRSYYDDLTVNIALESREAREMRQFWDVQAAWGASSLSALHELAEMDREATLSQRSRVKSYYAATDGDSWESISRKQFRTPDRAEDIRHANGIEAGALPVPGELYVIPR
jgi:hypothetical protein